jgi:uncharacterized membrane protein YczE
MPGSIAWRVAGVPPDRRGRRFTQLLAGLTLFGASAALQLRTSLGLDPWDVFHQGLSRTLGLQVGTWSIIVGAVVLLGWIPLRQRPGVGTLINVVLIGAVMNVVLDVVPWVHGMPLRFAVLVAAIVGNGVATGLYIGAGLGPGPRDGLMTGIAARGHSIRVVRTCIEVCVLALGWLLGGNVGIGTLLFAVGIGPIVHVTIPAFALASTPREPAYVPSVLPVARAGLPASGGDRLAGGCDLRG